MQKWHAEKACRLRKQIGKQREAENEWLLQNGLATEKISCRMGLLQNGLFGSGFV